MALDGLTHAPPAPSGVAALRPGQEVDLVPAYTRTERLALAHCVLTHHGPDAAPGRRFASAEAVALDRLNALESAVKVALEQGLS